MDESGILLFHPDRRTAAADVAGERKQLLDVNHLATLVAADLGRQFQIHFEVARYHADKQAVTVSPQDQGLENPLDIFPKRLRDVSCGEVILRIFVRDEFICYRSGGKKPGGVGLLDKGTFFCANLSFLC